MLTSKDHLRNFSQEMKRKDNNGSHYPLCFRWLINLSPSHILRLQEELCSHLPTNHYFPHAIISHGQCSSRKVCLNPQGIRKIFLIRSFITY